MATPEVLRVLHVVGEVGLPEIAVASLVIDLLQVRGRVVQRRRIALHGHARGLACTSRCWRSRSPRDRCCFPGNRPPPGAWSGCTASPDRSSWPRPRSCVYFTLLAK